MEAQNAIYLDKEMGGKGRQFKSRFLVPGLVKYDYGVCLLTKENADKFIQGFIGCPVVINHQDVTDANAKDVSVGNIFSVWFDEKDGYYWCNGIITDKHAIELIDKGYSVSCQYTITEYSDNNSGALHNGNPYDKIIENGKPEHLAIVNNPRYEGAIIAVNAINLSDDTKETEEEIEEVEEVASNSFVSQFKDTLYTALAEGIAKRLGELIASNEDKSITIHPHGKESDDYRRLKIMEGETVEDAMHRQGYYNKRQAKDEKNLKNELKQLYQDILKAKKDGNKELHHKLLERYKKIEEQLKGKKEPNKEDKKKEETTSKPIAGVSKGQPMSRQQADNNNPNPGYMKKVGCTSNCQTCVVAFEARLRGYNVQALGNHNNPTIKSLSHRTNTAWIDPKTGKHPEYKYDVSVKNAKTCYQWLEKELQAGNRYTIEFGWKGRRHTGHIVSIEKDKNNNIIIYDPQNGNITTEKNDVLRYFQRFKYQMSTYGMKIPDPPKVLRIDNLDFNYDVVDKILEKSN